MFMCLPSTQPTRTRAALSAACVIIFLALLALACKDSSMAIGGLSRYVCPSSTPRSTNTPQPTSPPTYPMGFLTNLDYPFVDSTRTAVSLRYAAQSVGLISLSYSGVFDTGQSWIGSNGFFPIDEALPGWPGFYRQQAVFIPPNVTQAFIQIQAGIYLFSFTVLRYATPVQPPPTPAPFPCCLPLPILPTPVPTYTPYPSPTTYQITVPEAFFLGDPVYNDTPPIRLRLRMTSIRSGTLQLPFLPGISAATWTVQITNVGTEVYAFLGAGYTFVTGVKGPDGVLQRGVWAPEHLAAWFLGINEQAYSGQLVQPGQTISVTVAAWIPSNSAAYLVSLVADPRHQGDMGWATFVPGSAAEQRLLTWKNETNTICSGEISPP